MFSTYSYMYPREKRGRRAEDLQMTAGDTAVHK